MLLCYEPKRQILCQNITLEVEYGVISIVTEELGRKQVTLDPKSAGIKIDVKLAKVATSSFQGCSPLHEHERHHVKSGRKGQHFHHSYGRFHKSSGSGYF